MSSIAKQQTSQTIFSILFTIAFTHFINDMCQSVIPSTYPMMKAKYHLTFSQIGLITFSFQLTASLLQPFIGHFTDRTPRPFSLMLGMTFTLLGLACLSQAGNFYSILASAACVGVGSSIFHPESSRVAFLASGGRRGLAQSIFQLGGNAGAAFGPLLVAIIVMPYGQSNIIWFGAAAITGALILMRVGAWYRDHLALKAAGKTNRGQEEKHHLPRNKVLSALAILLLLIFSKYFYMTSMTSYYTFFLIDKFHLSAQQSQFYLFIFLGAIATGTLAGGPLGDRFGRKYIIWFSILGAAPFTLLLPYANLFWTGVLAAIIGVIIASAFSAILVYAQELVPGRVGTISGLFFGFAFGIAGIGSALLGKLADSTSISFVFHVCAFLPLLGIITGLLPNLERK